MAPFYNFSQGISLEAAGEPLGSVSALNLANGSVTVADGVATFTAPSITFQGGTISAVPSIMNIESGLVLTSSSSALTVVQKSVNAALGATPAVGNTVVAVTAILGTGHSAPGGMSGYNTLASGYNGYTGGAVYSQTYETGNNTAVTNGASDYVIYELSGVASVDGYAEEATVAGGAATITVAARSNPSLIYAAFLGNVGNGPPSPSIPVGFINDINYSSGNTAWFGYVTNETEISTVGYSAGDINDPFHVVAVIQSEPAGEIVMSLAT